MWWLSYFCLGLFFGGVLFTAVRFGAQAGGLRFGVPVVAAVILVGSALVITWPRARNEVASYPIGLLAAALVCTADIALAGFDVSSGWRRVLSAVHIIAALTFTLVPIYLFSGPALAAIR